MMEATRQTIQEEPPITAMLADGVTKAVELPKATTTVVMLGAMEEQLLQVVAGVLEIENIIAWNEKAKHE